MLYSVGFYQSAYLCKLQYYLTCRRKNSIGMNFYYDRGVLYSYDEMGGFSQYTAVKKYICKYSTNTEERMCHS